MVLALGQTFVTNCYNGVELSRVCGYNDSVKFEGLPCHYCGVPAATVDHVVPQSLIEQYRLTGDPSALHKLLGSGRILEVPACRQCNSIASDHYHKTLAERKAFIQARLRVKYRKLLEMPDWTDDELEEMGPLLQAHIVGSLNEKRLVQQRIAW